jgi:DNA adenine methylase
MVCILIQKKREYMKKEVKPLFKYIGGKRWLRDKLRESFTKILSNENKSFTTYVEPFVGGMGAFLSVYDLLEDFGIKKVILNDINSNVINIYKVINEENGFKIKDLVQEIVILEKSFISFIPAGTKKLHKLKEKNQIKLELKDANCFFLEKRKRFNVLLKNEMKSHKEILESCALLIFLQSHCFNGIYRENSRGEYNTPFNWDVKEKTEKQLLEDINSIKNVFDKFDLILMNKSAIDFIFDKNSFYYLDPPYLNEDEVENKYNKEHFDKKQQLNLISMLNGISFVYSNHNSDIIIDAFNLHKKEYVIEIVKRKNIISASVESRKEDKEEIIVASK